MKNNQRNYVNYFRMSDVWRLVGAGLLITGLLLLWLGWGFLSWILMLLFVPTGLFLFLFTSSIRAGDADIDGEIVRKTGDLTFRPEEDPVLCKKVIKNSAPFVAEGYVFKEGVMLAKDKTGRLRSSEYSKAILFLLTDRVYVLHRRVSLIREDSVTNAYEIPYADLESMELLRTEERIAFGKRSFLCRITRFEIKYGDGILSITTNDDVESENLIERVRKLKKKNTEESV